MATTTNFGWETPDDTDLVKDGAAAMRTLGSAIDTSLVDLKGGTTSQLLAKNSNTDLDFVWTTVAKGGYTLLSTTSLSGSSTTVSITGTGYVSLMIEVTDFSMSAGNQTFFRFNSDSGSNYRWSGIRQYGSTSALSSAAGNVSSILSSFTPRSNQADSVYLIHVWNSQQTDAYKVGHFQLYAVDAGGGTPEVDEFGDFTYKGTAAISGFTFATLSGASFTGGQIRVYGVS